ncbi:hypothetical protein CWI42_030540 [Ordospora colligata]|uniref:Uncharacterized protein n=1 Tax=Ordospora colligata OC4 TaxID=1354746 RepID=A0A0B2UM30_9MICR|nr:uncharacterized protein M896_030250 [Ordospora colligata OC4]KHN70040.1 hypothetical protein M896_030250 [Ordospora colligata OC4]TBU16422.1 hypothetical protein CWI41_030210 [Ordospora colligata]TBU16607.1 hypothetical protein CWI40_030610 [Ordospora colligata]TBU19180.1 hypothetical protein CWI42_030540 [Ordospora colligata]
MNDKCHILPVFIPEQGDAKMVDYCDMSSEKIIIRGIECVRKQMENNICLHLDGVDIRGEIFYWSSARKCNESTFEKGLSLVSKGLGFSEDEEKK